MGEWHKVEPRRWTICDGCQMGYASVSQKTVNGELYTKTDDCHETCERYKEFLEEGYRINHDIYAKLAKH